MRAFFFSPTVPPLTTLWPSTNLSGAPLVLFIMQSFFVSQPSGVTGVGPRATPSLLLLSNRKWGWTCEHGFSRSTPTTNFFGTVYRLRWSSSFAGFPLPRLVMVGVKV